MKIAPLFYSIAFILLAFSSCIKTFEQPNIEPIKSKHVQFTVNNVWENSDTPLALNQDFHHSGTNETFNFQKCNYYLSNFQLRKTNGEWWSHPFSYFLVRLTANHQYQFDLVDVPFGEYDALRFMVGVDSTKNVSGAQAGDLAPSNSMFWSWSTGYIMIKIEGNSPHADLNYFSFHLGGFRNSDNSNITRWKEIEFTSNNLLVTGQISPKISLNADISKAWSSQNKLETYNSLHAPNSLAHLMADQFLSGFSLKNVE